MTDSDLPKNTRPPDRSLSPAMIGLVAVLIALTAVVTVVPPKFLTTAKGYFNLSDVMITFSSLIFGPWVGMVTGGVGTALADLYSGFAPFAPLSFLAHGAEGFLIGWLGRGQRSVGRMILAWFVGSVAMVAIYLVGEGLFYTGWPLALGEVPVNVIQALLGAIIGIPLVLAVRKAYPPIDRIGQRGQWTEE